MKKSFRSYLIMAAASIMATASLAVAAVSNIADKVLSTCRAFKNYLVDTFLGLASAEPGTPEVVPIVRAKEFILRIARRERVILTNSWRSCPSI